nr:MAG TPA: VPS28 protein [Caudoviricetes sp.]
MNHKYRILEHMLIEGQISRQEFKERIDTIKPDTYMGLAQQYIKDEISDEEFTKRCDRLKRIPINTYVSISEKFMQGEISEDEFVERYNRLIEQEAEKHWEPVEPHEHI